MGEALSTALLGLLVIIGGFYAAFRWIVLPGQPDHGYSRWQMPDDRCQTESRRPLADVG